MTETKAIQPIKSGIEGLDIILAGGIPSNRMYLLEGDPGSGKTTLAIQFLLEGLRQNENCLYIALSESAAELRAVAKSHHWDLRRMTIYELPFQDQLSANAPNTFFHISEIELGATNQAILEEIRRVRPHRVVIDSLTELKLLAQDSMKFRRHIFSLKQFFLEQGATVLLLDDKTSSISDQEVKSIVHGIIKLEQLSPEYGAERRRLRVLKLRGVPFRGGYHDFSIRTGGLTIFPRLVAAEHGAKEEEQTFIYSGVRGIDQLTGGGIDRGTSTLLLGPAGAGKSTVALQYASEAAARGEHAFVFAFDEGMRTLINRTRSLGIEIEKYIESGLITIQFIDPAELSPGEFSYLVRESVEKSRARVIVIDSLNGYLNAMPEERFLIIQMHELLSYLNQQGVVTFLVVAQHGLLGSGMETSVDISYLADNVVLFRYFEVQGGVRQALSVLKRRSGMHERTIRELLFSSKGINVGEPLKKFHGVLTGVPLNVNPGGEELLK